MSEAWQFNEAERREVKWVAIGHLSRGADMNSAPIFLSL
jgi:hypothetical protein